MRASEQQVEVGQQVVNVSDGCSPVVEGGELRQDVLRRQTHGKRLWLGWLWPTSEVWLQPV